jgi:hypothetical protein
MRKQSYSKGYRRFVSRQKRINELWKKALSRKTPKIPVTYASLEASDRKYEELKKLRVRWCPTSPEAIRDRKDQEIKRIPNLTDGYELKNFVSRWYKGIVKTMISIFDAEEAAEAAEDDESDVNTGPKKKTKVQNISRSNLSATRPKDERMLLYSDKTLSFNNKGFFGTPLPLIPDVRKTEVSDGVVGLLLESLGVKKRFDRVVTLQKGPNKRLNRYLVYNYKRLIKSIDGTLVPGNVDKMAHVIWEHDFYKLTSPDNYLSARQRKELRRKARKFWGIANQLIKQSISFRTAVLRKILGKTDRWFHRDFDIVDLNEIFNHYQKIADKYSSRIEIRRCWISTEQRNGSYKWRPLGIADYPWRIFTRAINNVLETFISASWPDNQHGYKGGRGVHTVWSQVLNSVINSKYILEFDFTGFFNTVRVEAVGETLERLMTPKYMIAYLVNISSRDLINISKKYMEKLDKSKDPKKQGFGKAWDNYEFIHKFREGYRSVGLPQGFALSPLLSVISLVALDELKDKGIKYVLYADDGLFYSNEPQNFLDEAQKVLDKHGIGAYFNKAKCKSVKENGVWLSKLKLVGLVYDPVTDVLAASTRNGATLKLKIGTVGYFSSEENLMSRLLYDYSNVELSVENDIPVNWIKTNKELFDLYEKIYLSENYGERYKNKLLDELITLVSEMMTYRFSKYSMNQISDMQQFYRFMDNHDITLENFIFPIRLLYNISKEEYSNQTSKYASWMDAPFPHDLIMKDPLNMETFWMDKKQTAKEFESQFDERRNNNEGLNKFLSKLGDLKNQTDNHVSETVLGHLHWFHQLDETPESIKTLLKDGELELGDWFELKSKDIDNLKLPKVVIEHYEKHGGSFKYTEVNWRNLHKDPVFATLIARLFQDSFKSGIIKQNFKLTTDKTSVTLVKLIDRYIGRKSLTELLKGETLNIFNSSSFCANLLVRLAETWVPAIKNVEAAKVKIHKRVYQDIIERLCNRRSNVDHFVADPEFFHRFGSKTARLTVTKKHEVTRLHLKKKLQKLDTLHTKTIVRSAICNQEVYTKYCENPRAEYIYPYKSVHWDTLAPLRPATRCLPPKVSKIVVRNTNHALDKRKWTKLSEHLKDKKIEKI